MRNVIVTGGSRGLGLAIARKLAATGYGVMARLRAKGPDRVGDRDQAPEMRWRPDGSPHFVPFDLERRSTDQIPKLVPGRLRKEFFGPAYGLVNNAALGEHGSAFSVSCTIRSDRAAHPREYPFARLFSANTSYDP